MYPSSHLRLYSLGFIVTRRVNDVTQEAMWRECVSCIRKWYPTEPIVIIDDHSPVPVDEGLLDPRTELKMSWLPPGAGEQLPYLYLRDRNRFDKAVVLHDSVFLRRAFDERVLESVDTVRFLWSTVEDEGFRYESYVADVLSRTPCTDDVRKGYANEGWRSYGGCFGAMCIVDRGFLAQVFARCDLSVLATMRSPEPSNRFHRTCFERIFSLACYSAARANEKSLPASLYGPMIYVVPTETCGDANRFVYEVGNGVLVSCAMPVYGLSFENYLVHKKSWPSLECVKVWSSR